MTVQELNREQYKELCQAYITEFWTDDEHGTSGPSMYELACADELVSEDVIYRHYEGINFVPEDFGCSNMKRFEVRPGYYEWNIYCNDELLDSIDDASGQLSEEITEDMTYDDLRNVAYLWADAIFENLDESEYNRTDYYDIVDELTRAWSNHWGIKEV